jgi:hypothetical protein
MLHQIGDQIVINHYFWPRFAPSRGQTGAQNSIPKSQEIAFAGSSFQNFPAPPWGARGFSARKIQIDQVI